MTNKLLVSVGNSFASGIIGDHGMYVESYVVKFNKYINYDLLNLAQRGASNYHIAKQIEYIITERLNPDLVVICTGPSHRISDEILFSTTTLVDRPHIKNFEVVDGESPPYKVGPVNLVSRTYKFFLQQMKKFEDEKNWKEYEHNKIIYDYIIKLVNKNVLRADQDMYLMLGACTLLEKANIKHILIDYAGLFEERKFLPKCPVLHYKWYDLKLGYPTPNTVEDDIHFNEDGHTFISEELIKTYRNMKLGM